MLISEWLKLVHNFENKYELVQNKLKCFRLGCI